MLRTIRDRLLMSVPLLLVVTLVSFVLNSLSPTDLARTILGADGTQAQYLELRHELGLDRPVVVQYASWLGRALQGDLGTSYLTKQRVTAMVLPRLGVTLCIVAGVMAVCVSLGLLLGVASALRGGWIGKAIDVLSLTGLMLPSFLVALLFIVVFAVWLRWLPATGYVMFSQDPAGWLASLVLPVLSVSLLPIANIAKQTRDSMNDVLRRDFIRSLRACGLPERTVVWKHALRNAALPVVTVLGVVMIGAISGAVFVERVFVLPGLGSLAVSAAQTNDIVVLQGATLFFGLLAVAINLVVDLSYGWLNPRVRVA